MNTLIIFVLLLLLMLTGMPISISLGLTVLTFLFTLTQVPIESVALKLFTGIEKFEVMAIPFFILAGNFLTHGGVAKRMINFCTSMIGHWYGGMGLAGVMACALFAAISGSSVATVVAVGSIMLPAMVKQGYPKRFGAGVIATSGALGILFPPSINLVIYAIATAGMMMEPIATTVAGLEPDTAANSAQAITPASARPPCQWPTSVVANLIIRRATPPCVRKPPARMKNGIAMISNFSMPVNSFNATASTGTLVKVNRKVSTVRPSEMEMGMPVSIRVSNRQKMMRVFMVGLPPGHRSGRGRGGALRRCG